MTGLGRLGSVAVTATAARLRVGATGRVLVQAVTSAGQYINYQGESRMLDPPEGVCARQRGSNIQLLRTSSRG
jgi:hypothetical protein